MCTTVFSFCPPPKSNSNPNSKSRSDYSKSIPGIKIVKYEAARLITRYIGLAEVAAIYLAHTWGLLRFSETAIQAFRAWMKASIHALARANNAIHDTPSAQCYCVCSTTASLALGRRARCATSPRTIFPFGSFSLEEILP